MCCLHRELRDGLSGKFNDWFDFTNSVYERNSSSNENDQRDCSTREKGVEREETANNRTGPTKSDYLKRQTTLLRAIQKNSELVDGDRKCGIPTCPLRHKPGSRYCIYHSAAISDLVLGFEFTDLKLPKWQLKLEPAAVDELQALKEQYERGSQTTWVIDVEFYVMKGGISPIPFQIAIRQLDGKLLLSTNVDYDLSLQRFLDQTKDEGTIKRILPSLFRRYYGCERTNGMKPSKISTIIKQLGYRPDRTKILSWYSALDMQCFLRLLSGKDDLIVPRISHHLHSNFQEIHIGNLLRKLLHSSWPTTSLPLVHTAILASCGREERNSHYHTAEYDTKAVVDVVREMIALLR
ncbi:hypothetical protein BJX63DRAFT_186835 [Aspergillus granulosus]|uniref:Uncharacterized protein n=1 Tax=Aspergillus granulosus TaxID=176169 RepID=A0ABR4HHL4_9EURO